LARRAQEGLHRASAIPLEPAARDLRWTPQLDQRLDALLRLHGVHLPALGFLRQAGRCRQEVWFGILFTGWAAKVAEIPHWAVYAAGTFGFWKMRSWMWPWAAVYTAQIAVGMLVWSLRELEGGRAWFAGVASFVPFAALTYALWKARPRFQRSD
jgi:hypothetical protein